MRPAMILLFNHRLTGDQEMAACRSFAPARFVYPPGDIQRLWRQVPPPLESLENHVQPVKRWLEKAARKGDVVLIQGDFGATYLMVQFAFERGLVPVYATTERLANEQHQADGSVTLTHCFRHCRFRRYGL